MINNNFIESFGKPVVIEIQGKQSFRGCEPETVELVTEGIYARNGKKTLISYAESEVTGFDGTITTFEVGEKNVTLSRQGTVISEMVFELGKRHTSLYSMGFGAMAIGVNARRVRQELDDNGGTLEVDYAIEIEHVVAGENSFKIKVRDPAAKAPVQ